MYTALRRKKQEKTRAGNNVQQHVRSLPNAYPMAASYNLVDIMQMDVWPGILLKMLTRFSSQTVFVVQKVVQQPKAQRQ